MNVTAVFEKGGEKNFSCFLEEDTGKCGLLGYGNSAKQAEEDLFLARREYIEIDGEDVPEITITRRKFDVGSFFSYYPLNITQFAKFAGLNASQLRQYVSGSRNPCRKKKIEIQEAVQSLGKILSGGGCAIDTDPLS